MKVHITLVGKQIQPIYRTINALSPDYVVYIYSSESKEEVKGIKKFLKTEVDCEEVEMSPTDPFIINKKAEELAVRFAYDDVTVNISGGLKSWSYFFGLVFSRQENFAVLYIDQNNILYNYSTFESEQIQSDDIINEIPIASYVDFNTYTPEDKDVALKIQNLRRFDHTIFKEITITIPNNEKTVTKGKTGIIRSIKSPSSYVTWEKANEDNPNTKITFCIEKKDGRKLEVTLLSPHAFDLLFYTGWFEYKIAYMLSRWKKAKRVLMNCRFKTNENKEKNEVDIIVDAGEKAIFVECKTQISKSTDIDKFNSVVKNYGGTASKGVFITEAKMEAGDIEKCNDHKLLHFSLMTSTNALSDLHDLLNTKIYNINT